MTELKYKVLKELNKSESGRTLPELLEKFSDPDNLNVTLSEMEVQHWVFCINEQDNHIKLSGVGENELRKENIYRNSYRITIATLLISLTSLIIAVVSLLATLL